MNLRFNMKRIILIRCKIFGHEYRYNFGYMPTKCECTKCGTKWKSRINPDFKHPLKDDALIWDKIK